MSSTIMAADGKVCMVKGPATVGVEGTCEVLGSDVSGKTIIVKVGKALPFEPDHKCRLHITLGDGGSTWLADPAVAGTSMWRGIAHNMLDLLLANRKRKKAPPVVMLVGDTDTGKSTLSAYLANMALIRGFIPCIVDGDIGQGDLAPPTAIGAAALTRQITDLRDVSASTFEFVGSTSPAGFERIVARKLRVIVERVLHLGDVCIVNTDGYVKNGGIPYKLMVAKALRPDMIVRLGENPELFAAFKKEGVAFYCKVLRARSSTQTIKSKAERTGRRLDQFLRYTGKGSSSVDMSQVKFVYKGSALLAGDLVESLENIKGTFVGLGLRGMVTGFGIVTGISLDTSSSNNNNNNNDYSGKTIIIHIQTNARFFDMVYLSNVRLSDDRTTEIRLSPC